MLVASWNHLAGLSLTHRDADIMDVIMDVAWASVVIKIFAGDSSMRPKLRILVLGDVFGLHEMFFQSPWNLKNRAICL